MQMQMESRTVRSPPQLDTVTLFTWRLCRPQYSSHILCRKDGVKHGPWRQRCLHSSRRGVRLAVRALHNVERPVARDQ
eukprot:2261850-Prymnesium_polylepis.1